MYFVERFVSGNTYMKKRRKNIKTKMWSSFKICFMTIIKVHNWFIIIVLWNIRDLQCCANLDSMQLDTPSTRVSQNQQTNTLIRTLRVRIKPGHFDWVITSKPDHYREHTHTQYIHKENNINVILEKSVYCLHKTCYE